jgi:hypothetical protein
LRIAAPQSRPMERFTGALWLARRDPRVTALAASPLILSIAAVIASITTDSKYLLFAFLSLLAAIFASTYAYRQDWLHPSHRTFFRPFFGLLLLDVAMAAACSNAVPAPDASTSASTSTSESSSGAGVGGGLNLPTSTSTTTAPCDAGQPDALPEASTCDASAAVSFEGQIRPILSNCGGELCHAAWTYESLMGKVGTGCCDGRLVVRPGDPAGSYLLDKLGNRDLCSGGRMPLGRAPLTPVQMQAIADWICEGAPMN